MLLIISLIILYISLIWLVKGASDTIVKINKDLRNSYEELKEIDKIKTEFMHTISHELRTPLNGIIGYSDLLLQKNITDFTENDKRDIAYINNNGKRLNTLINDILDLSEFESDKSRLKIEKTSVNKAIQTTLNLIEESAKRRNVKLDPQLDPVIDIIDADAHKLNKILYNIIENAVKFSKSEGGLVTVTTSKENNMLRISIKDNGIGIKDEFKKKMFKKFSQADPSDTRHHGGLGLGLALAKELIELHDGKIIFESEYGKGSTFNIFLPIERK